MPPHDCLHSLFIFPSILLVQIRRFAGLVHQYRRHTGLARLAETKNGLSLLFSYEYPFGSILLPVPSFIPFDFLFSFFLFLDFLSTSPLRLLLPHHHDLFV